MFVCAASFQTQAVVVDDMTVKFEIWDTAGSVASSESKDPGSRLISRALIQVNYRPFLLKLRSLLLAFVKPHLHWSLNLCYNFCDN